MEQQSSANVGRLHADLAARMVALFRRDGWAPGTRLAEERLARTLLVSRTPVRAALRELSARGVARARDGGGFELADLDAAGSEPDGDALPIAITRDRVAGRLPDVVSEADLMRRYGAGRRRVQSVLAQLAAVALVERRLGHGWAFLPSITDGAARAESYRWRAIIEPAALLEPGYRLAPAWIADMRARHGRMLAETWSETSSPAFYEMNAAFHAGLAAGAGNRFLSAAVEQQNGLRRARNYDWVYGAGRVVVNCREHLELLDRIEAGEMELAAALLRRHLVRAAALRRPDEGGE